MYKLQKLLISSSSAKYICVKLVTEDNLNKKTPNVDNRIILSPNDKFTFAEKLTLDGYSSRIIGTSIPKASRSKKSLRIITIEDRAKQMLAYLALSPQWEANFDSGSYGFRPGRFKLDAIEAISIGISRNPKWVLNAAITQSSNQINHQYLLEKCNTFLEMRKQIRAWLKKGILDRKESILPEMGTPEGDIITYLLVNIALHGLRKSLDNYINTISEQEYKNHESLIFVHYGDRFIVMHPNQKILYELLEVIQQFLEPIGLKLNPNHTRVGHTLNSEKDSPPGFIFLGFYIHQRIKWRKSRTAVSEANLKQKFITLIVPSKEIVKKHKSMIREIIRRYRGTSQEKLIQKLNPIIRAWALSKRTQGVSRTFQALDKFMFIHLWKWARKRHPKMSKSKLKKKYWHQLGTRNWVFGLKTNNKVSLELQLHSKLLVGSSDQAKGAFSPFNRNLTYWSKRAGHNSCLIPIKSRVIMKNYGQCEIFRELFLPNNITEKNHITSKPIGGFTRLNTMYDGHYYSHQDKKKVDL